MFFLRRFYYCLHSLPTAISLTTLISLSRSFAISSATMNLFCTFLLSPVLFCPPYIGFPHLLARSILPCTSPLADITPTTFLPSLQSFCSLSLLANAHSVSAVRCSSPYSIFSVDIELNPGSANFTLCTLNIRSIIQLSHFAALCNLIDTHNPDLFFILKLGSNPLPLPLNF